MWHIYRSKVLENLTVPELRDKARDLGIRNFWKMKRDVLIAVIKEAQKESKKNPNMSSKSAQEIFDELKDKALAGELEIAEINESSKLLLEKSFDWYKPEYRELMDLYRHYVSWAVYTKEWLDYMAKKLKGKTVLEICSGTGTLANNMRKRGINWIATDSNDWRKDPEVPPMPIYIDDLIEIDAVEAVKTADCDVVFGSWIPYKSNIDFEVGKICMAKNIPFIIVGEGPWGCTGSNIFWETFGHRIHGVDSPRFSWRDISDSTYILVPEEPGRQDA